MAAERIKAAITLTLVGLDPNGSPPIKAILDAYNPTGSTAYVNFTTSKATRWQTDPRKCHVNWVVCDSDWEAELCRVVEAHPAVQAYVKNQALGLEVPYLMGSITRKYIPDFIVRVNDGQPEPLNLIVEIKGYREENAKDKANTIRSYWVPGVNNLRKFGRWAFAEFTSVYDIETEFDKLVRNLSGTGGDRPPSQSMFEQSSPYDHVRQRSLALVNQQFGAQPNLTKLCDSIWDQIESRGEPAIRLNDLRQAAANVACSDNDMLAVIGLLSGPAAQLLTMEMHQVGFDGASVNVEEFVSRLAAWLGGKDVSNREWREWAAGVDVKWVPTFLASNRS